LHCILFSPKIVLYYNTYSVLLREISEQKSSHDIFHANENCLPVCTDKKACRYVQEGKYLPKTKTVASDSGIDIFKRVITHSSPGSIMKDFQTSLVRRCTASQPHCHSQHGIKSNGLILCSR